MARAADARQEDEPPTRRPRAEPSAAEGVGGASAFAAPSAAYIWKGGAAKAFDNDANALAKYRKHWIRGAFEDDGVAARTSGFEFRAMSDVKGCAVSCRKPRAARPWAPMGNDPEKWGREARLPRAVFDVAMAGSMGRRQERVKHKGKRAFDTGPDAVMIITQPEDNNGHLYSLTNRPCGFGPLTADIWTSEQDPASAEPLTGNWADWGSEVRGGGADFPRNAAADIIDEAVLMGDDGPPTRDSHLGSATEP